MERSVEKGVECGGVDGVSGEIDPFVSLTRSLLRSAT